MTAGDRFRERVRAYRMAFLGAAPSAWWARLAARIGLARLARFFLADPTWLAIVLAELREECDARRDQTTFERDDAAGRVQAFREGKRQAYLYLERMIGLDPGEIDREARARDLEEERLMGAGRRMNAA